MFRQNASLLNGAYRRLCCLPGAVSPRGRLVCGGLALLAGHALEFDREAHPDFSLQKHFLHLLASLPEKEDELWWLEVFEDIALFVREKCLRSGGPQRALERGILRHFEHCGEWPADTTTLVGVMYWRELPRRLAKKT